MRPPRLQHSPLSKGKGRGEGEGGHNSAKTVAATDRRGCYMVAKIARKYKKEQRGGDEFSTMPYTNWHIIRRADPTGSGGPT